MVAEGDFIASGRLRFIVQHAAPHPGAQAARIFFFTRFKDNFAELRAPQPVGDFQLAAQLLNGGIVCFNPTEAGVERSGLLGALLPAA